LKAVLHPTRRERGQGLVEFAIIFPFLLLMLMGITEFGFLFLTAHNVQNASREGARLAIKLEDLQTNDSRVSSHVESLLPSEDLYAGFFGGTTNTAVTSCGSNDQVIVTVAGTYDFVALNLLGLNSLNMSFPTTMRWEYCD
jgi:Flp pilus assembly protein TadG